MVRPIASVGLSITLLALMQGFLEESFMPVMPEVIRVPAWIPIFEIPHIYAFISALQSLISVLLFTAMYFIGKRTALKQQLRSVLTMLMLGGWGGLFLGQALAMGPEVLLPTWQNYPYFMLWQFFAMFPSAIFLLFLSFTALAIAHIRGLGENLSRGAEAEPVVEGRERPRRPNFGLTVIGLVLILVGLGAIFLWTRYPSPIALVLAMLCIFIGLVLVGSGMGLGWFPMMGVEKWKLGNSLS